MLGRSYSWRIVCNFSSATPLGCGSSSASSYKRFAVNHRETHVCPWLRKYRRENRWFLFTDKTLSCVNVLPYSRIKTVCVCVCVCVFRYTECKKKYVHSFYTEHSGTRRCNILKRERQYYNKVVYSERVSFMMKVLSIDLTSTDGTYFSLKFFRCDYHNIIWANGSLL